MISTYPVLSFFIKNRQILAYYNHFIFKFDLLKYSPTRCDRSISAIRICDDNISYCYNQNDFYVGRMIGYLHTQAKYTEGFLFYKDGVPVGFIWVMYSGGNEFQYRVRNTPAFLFDLCVFEEFRGQGICGTILSHIFNYLKNDKKLKEVQLAVRKNNHKAIRAYQKAGGIIIRSCGFLQIVRKYNLPYHKV